VFTAFVFGRFPVSRASGKIRKRGFFPLPGIFEFQRSVSSHGFVPMVPAGGIPELSYPLYRGEDNRRGSVFCLGIHYRQAASVDSFSWFGIPALFWEQRGAKSGGYPFGMWGMDAEK
jgi:hypothetical protein